MWLPDAQILPPIQRGDLYHARMLGFSFFLIIDGVFFNELAVSPREILDVLQDGGVVLGASSMGALRAAECWPAGMQGVGSIYRLFRRGSLMSDDEVAVVFNPEIPLLTASVPLINVRYALSHAVRERRLAKTQADRVLTVARELFYAERVWMSILQGAGIPDEDGSLVTFLRTHDLKRIDANRALRTAMSMIQKNPELLQRPRAAMSPFVSQQYTRELPHDPIGSDEPNELKDKIWRWLMASGRYRWYILPLLSLLPSWAGDGSGGSVLDKSIVDDFLVGKTGMDRNRWLEHRAVRIEDLARSLARQTDLVHLCKDLVEHEQVIVDALWGELVISGELDPMIYRFRAFTQAAAEARARSWKPSSEHRFLADGEIANVHGFGSWEALQAELGSHDKLWSWIMDYREDLSLAKRFREELFTVPGVGFLSPEAEDQRS